MRTIVITGTPGTGKTLVSRKLASKLKFHYIDVNKFIDKKKLSEGFDKKRKSRIIDVNKLGHALIKEIRAVEKQNRREKGIIIDSHLSHYLPGHHVDLCIVMKCDIKELSKRLKKKKFHRKKIEENLQAEIFDICHEEAKQLHQKILVIDTTKGFNIKDLAKKLGD